MNQQKHMNYNTALVIQEKLTEIEAKNLEIEVIKGQIAELRLQLRDLYYELCGGCLHREIVSCRYPGIAIGIGKPQTTCVGASCPVVAGKPYYVECLKK